MEATRLISAARRGAGLTQNELAKRAGTSQATLSTYERGLKSPSIKVAERIIAAAGYELALGTTVNFIHHTSPGLRPFWVPDRLWRGRLPECFATVYLQDGTRAGGTRRFDLRRRPPRKRMYEMLLRRGRPEELMDWIDGALLVDLWDELAIPQVVRRAWEPAVDLAGNGPVEEPWYGLPATGADFGAVKGSRASSQPEPLPTRNGPRPE